MRPIRRNSLMRISFRREVLQTTFNSSYLRKASCNRRSSARQLFTGKKRNPDRNILLQLLFAMGCTLTEANRALQAAGKNSLYCKNRRDAIIIFCLDRGYSLQEADQALFDFGEQTISGEA